MSFLLRFIALCLPAVAIAASASVPATAPSGLMSVAQVVLALGFVICLILCSAWLMRRLSVLPVSNGQTLRVVSGVMVGSKERVVVVEVQGSWLVLGVTASSVNLLHTVEAPEQGPAPEIQPFAQQLSAKLAAVLQRNTR